MLRRSPGYWRNPIVEFVAFTKLHGACALEVFSGCGAFSRAFRQKAHLHGLAIFEWDIRWSPQHDLLEGRLQKLLRGWLRSGLVRLLWLGTPCTTFTSMQNLRAGGPLRTAALPFGVEGLPPHQQANVSAGNIFLRLSASLLAICRRMNIIAVMENPHTSSLWQNPLVVRMRGWKEAQ